MNKEIVSSKLSSTKYVLKKRKKKNASKRKKNFFFDISGPPAPFPFNIWTLDKGRGKKKNKKKH